MEQNAIGRNILRKESWDKVTGHARYAYDLPSPGLLYAKICTSSVAHARIKSIDTAAAKGMPGVKAVITGADRPVLCGVLIQDRPVLAIDRVRHWGEPVALVVALSEHEAESAAEAVQVAYDPLPPVCSASQALLPETPPIHEKLSSYILWEEDLYPEGGTNIASRYDIQKGDLRRGWAESEAAVCQRFYLPQSDHAAMETRTATARIMPGGAVHITAASQCPYTVKELVSRYFAIDEGRIHVHVPFVGGAFGGKTAVQLELLALLASQAVSGRPVNLTHSREQDMASAPGRLGLEAEVKFGATGAGVIKAAELVFYLDAGAYANIAPYMAKAIAANCTGPYHIENVSCRSLCVYTNHCHTTAFRGFAHESFTFCIERAIDALAAECAMDPLELRRKNAIAPGNFSPTQVEITRSNTGDLGACIAKLHALIGWEEGSRIVIGEDQVRAKGVSCLWKAPNSPTDASSGAVITFNSDGSLNLITGVVEMGSGSQTLLVQLLAEKMQMRPDRIYVKTDVDTQTNPKHWKTVASISGYLAGRAVLRAADDVIGQLKSIASVALRCPADDLAVANERVYIRHLPKYGMGFQDLVFGLKYPDGNTVGSPVIGRGSFIMSHLTPLAQEMGKGKPGHAWTVGAQGVEVELDLKECTYRILKAATVMDVGRLVNPDAAKGVIRSGMSMGVSLATREEFIYDQSCVMQNTSLRTYKLLHIGQEPQYLVDFVETPQEDAPYGTRIFSEHGIIGIPAALANALSAAAGAPMNTLPLSFETVWNAMKGGTP